MTKGNNRYCQKFDGAQEYTLVQLDQLSVQQLLKEIFKPFLPLLLAMEDMLILMVEHHLQLQVSIVGIQENLKQSVLFIVMEPTKILMDQEQVSQTRQCPLKLTQLIILD